MPPTSGSTSITVHGRTYSCAVGGVLDVTDQDAVVMTANGWTAVSYNVGTTAQRPAVPTRGMAYTDTTISKNIVWDGAKWRDPLTGNAV
jgi:hypothetical protein